MLVQQSVHYPHLPSQTRFNLNDIVTLTSEISDLNSENMELTPQFSYLIRSKVIRRYCNVSNIESCGKLYNIGECKVCGSRYVLHWRCHDFNLCPTCSVVHRNQQSDYCFEEFKRMVDFVRSIPEFKREKLGLLHGVFTLPEKYWNLSYPEIKKIVPTVRKTIQEFYRAMYGVEATGIINIHLNHTGKHWKKFPHFDAVWLNIGLSSKEIVVTPLLLSEEDLKLLKLFWAVNLEIYNDFRMSKYYKVENNGEFEVKAVVNVTNSYISKFPVTFTEKEVREIENPNFEGVLVPHLKPPKNYYLRNKKEGRWYNYEDKSKKIVRYSFRTPLEDFYKGLLYFSEEENRVIVRYYDKENKKDVVEEVKASEYLKGLLFSLNLGEYKNQNHYSWFGYLTPSVRKRYYHLLEKKYDTQGLKFISVEEKRMRDKVKCPECGGEIEIILTVLTINEVIEFTRDKNLITKLPPPRMRESFINYTVEHSGEKKPLPDSGAWECPYCKKIFETPYLCGRHIVLNHREKAFLVTQESLTEELPAKVEVDEKAKRFIYAVIEEENWERNHKGEKLLLLKDEKVKTK